MTTNSLFMLILEWGGCVSGVLGSLLLALKNRYSGYGFVLFFASNLFWAAFAISSNADGLLTQQAIFILTSLIGIKQWFFNEETRKV